MSGPPERIVVVGASAGGVEALTRLAGALPRDLPAAVFVVLHLPPAGTSVLPSILTRAGGLPAIAAADGDAIEAGRIYVAPPDRHLLVGPGEVNLTQGPRENGHRPAVDPLFRTAALAYGERTVGVILSGALDDGAAGLALVAEHGGTTLVQDPADALAPGMPTAALARTRADHVAPAGELGALVAASAAARGVPTGRPRLAPVPDPLAPADIADDEATGIACPDCGGSLWLAAEGGVPRFRCRTGHAYSEASLLSRQGSALETALWTALRSLEERVALLRRMSERAGSADAARRFAALATDVERQAEIIRAGVLPTAPVDAEGVG